MFRPKGTAGASSTADAQPNPTADFVRISSKTVLHKHVYRTGHAQVDLTARITLSYSDYAQSGFLGRVKRTLFVARN